MSPRFLLSSSPHTAMSFTNARWRYTNVSAPISNQINRHKRPPSVFARLKMMDEAGHHTLLFHIGQRFEGDFTMN